MTRATQKEQATTTLKKHFLNILLTFYQRNLRLSFLDWEPKCGDNIHHTVLSSVTGLESPKSLASIFGFVFRQSAKRLVLCASAWSSLCSSILVLFSIFELIVLSMLNEKFFVTCKAKRWRKLEIVAVSFSSSLSLLSLNSCTRWAKGVPARMQVGCHWILSFVLLLAHSLSSSSLYLTCFLLVV